MSTNHAHAGIPDYGDAVAGAEPGPYEKLSGERDGCPYFTIPAAPTANVIRALRKHRVLLN